MTYADMFSKVKGMIEQTEFITVYDTAYGHEVVNPELRTHDINESPNIEKSHVKFNYLDLLTSEYVNKEFIDMDTRYFGNGNIRNKFKEVEEDFLYKYLYEYDSQFEHGLWGAIRESSILKCTTSGHQFHGVPDIDNIQKMPDVGNDMISVMKKHIEIIGEAYPIPFLDIGKEDGFER